MTSRTPAPRLAIRRDDYEKLSALAGTHADPDVARALSEELDRAEVVDQDRLSPDVVAMNRTVEFRDEATGRNRRVTLVYPRDADILAGKLSVLTPIGAALIGMAEGESIDWETRDGQPRTLTVLRVMAQDAVAETVA